VHERIGLAIVALNEAEALHGIEELDRTLSLFAGQLALRPALCPLDRHRLALDPEIRRRDPAAAIDERELERLAVGKVRKARLLDCRNVDEHVLAAVVTDDKAETFLRIEEFYDAFAFANDLGRHTSTTAAAAAAEATAASTAAEAASASAAEAATVTVAASASASESAAVAKATTTAEAAAFLETPAEFTREIVVAAETVALVATATAALTLAPSIETHNRPNC
jgi:hypothetical protein